MKMIVAALLCAASFAAVAGNPTYLQELKPYLDSSTSCGAPKHEEGSVVVAVREGHGFFVDVVSQAQGLAEGSTLYVLTISGQMRKVFVVDSGGILTSDYPEVVESIIGKVSPTYSAKWKNTARTDCAQ